VKARQKTAELGEHRLSGDRTEAYDDARALAIELARGESSARFDPMTAGVVLQPGETVYRQVQVWIRVQQEGTWAEASSADVILTDGRLLCRFVSGRLASLWWSGVVGLHVDIATEHVVLDFGDAQPVCLAGPRVASVAVVAVASVYGPGAMLTHDALAPLRTWPNTTHSARQRHQNPESADA